MVNAPIHLQCLEVLYTYNHQFNDWDWVYHILGRKHGEHSSQQTMFHLKDSQKPNGSDTSFGRMEAVSIQNRSASESVVVPVCGKDSLFPCENPELSLVERRLWQIYDMVGLKLISQKIILWTKDNLSITPTTRCFQIPNYISECHMQEALVRRAIVSIPLG